MKPTTLTVISGSGRPSSESARVAAVILDMARNLGVEANLVDLHRANLPMWDDDTTSDAAWKKRVWTPLSTILQEADGFVVVTPEWDGIVPPQLKNLFVFCDDFELAHKPALIVSVSMSAGGSYPVAELRMSSYKNTQIVWLPTQIIIRNVAQRFTNASAENSEDTTLLKRMDTDLRLLVAYSNALHGVRADHQTEILAYPYGM